MMRMVLLGYAGACASAHSAVTNSSAGTTAAAIFNLSSFCQYIRPVMLPSPNSLVSYTGSG
jgi:hypothetical protein